MEGSMQNQNMQLQIFQGAGFQRGGVHAASCMAMAAPGFHAGGVYHTTRPAEPVPEPPAMIIMHATRKRAV